jgi:D-galacturonate reductase
MAPLNVCMVGTGEYTTGYVGGKQSGSDKKVGVVGLTLFDLRRRGKVGTLSMVGTTGSKFPAIREHLDKNITQVYNGLDTSFQSFPGDDDVDKDAYKKAIDALSPGDAITIFTPDPTHYPIALYAIQRKINVMITKPATKKLAEHQHLLEESRKHNVFVYVEHHKRFDPAYADARERAINGSLGDFNYFYSYMSQPKTQLETFKSWIGKPDVSSDISYYLNSHHVDVCESMIPEYRPVRVTASASSGIASELDCETEDTITLLVDWLKKSDPSRKATGVYTASWTAPKNAGLHSQQYFHAGFSKGEVRINQAKRGYEVTEDDAGLVWYNPFYMKYAKDEESNFAGQGGYGYVSFEKFVDGCQRLKDGKVTLDDLDKRGLPTLKNTLGTCAILEAGRISLDEQRTVTIREQDGEWSLH